MMEARGQSGQITDTVAGNMSRPSRKARCFPPVKNG
jgi:hypothetical protein